MSRSATTKENEQKENLTRELKGLLKVIKNPETKEHFFKALEILSYNIKNEDIWKLEAQTNSILTKDIPNLIIDYFSNHHTNQHSNNDDIETAASLLSLINPPELSSLIANQAINEEAKSQLSSLLDSNRYDLYAPKTSREGASKNSKKSTGGGASELNYDDNDSEEDQEDERGEKDFVSPIQSELVRSLGQTPGNAHTQINELTGTQSFIGKNMKTNTPFKLSRERRNSANNNPVFKTFEQELKNLLKKIESSLTKEGLLEALGILNYNIKNHTLWQDQAKQHTILTYIIPLKILDRYSKTSDLRSDDEVKKIVAETLSLITLDKLVKSKLSKYPEINPILNQIYNNETEFRSPHLLTREATLENLQNVGGRGFSLGATIQEYKGVTTPKAEQKGLLPSEPNDYKREDDDSTNQEPLIPNQTPDNGKNKTRGSLFSADSKPSTDSQTKKKPTRGLSFSVDKNPPTDNQTPNDKGLLLLRLARLAERFQKNNTKKTPIKKTPIKNTPSQDITLWDIKDIQQDIRNNPHDISRPYAEFFGIEGVINSAPQARDGRYEEQTPMATTTPHDAEFFGIKVVNSAPQARDGRHIINEEQTPMATTTMFDNTASAPVLSTASQDDNAARSLTSDFEDAVQNSDAEDTQNAKKLTEQITALIEKEDNECLSFLNEIIENNNGTLPRWALDVVDKEKISKQPILYRILSIANPKNAVGDPADKPSNVEELTSVAILLINNGVDLGKGSQTAAGSSEGGENLFILPIHIAAENADIKILQSILEKDATQINAKSDSRDTPLLLLLASKSNNENLYYCVDLLLYNGADANFIHPTDQNTVLTTTISNESVAPEQKNNIIKLLLHKTTLETINNKSAAEGETALHLAVKNSDSTTIEMLLLAGANPKIKNKNGKTPHDLADNIQDPQLKQSIQKALVQDLLGIRRKAYEKTAMARPFEKEKEYANSKMMQILKRPEVAVAAQKENIDTYKEGDDYKKELKQQMFLKKWALLVESGGLKINKKGAKLQDAKEIEMSVAQIMGCGARLVITSNSPVKGNQLINWLLSNEPETDLEKLKKPYIENLSLTLEKGQNIAYIRKAATHGFKGEKEVKKGVLEAADSSGVHLGVDLAMGAFETIDIHGRPVTMDGLHGHAYLHIDPITHNILLGLEQCTDPKWHNNGYWEVRGEFGVHNVRGASSNITGLGTVDFGRHNPKDTSRKHLPTKKDRYDCLKIDLDRMNLDKMLMTELNDISNDIVEGLPCSLDKDGKKIKNLNTPENYPENATLTDKIQIALARLKYFDTRSNSWSKTSQISANSAKFVETIMARLRDRSLDTDKSLVSILAIILGEKQTASGASASVSSDNDTDKNLELYPLKKELIILISGEHSNTESRFLNKNPDRNAIQTQIGFGDKVEVDDSYLKRGKKQGGLAASGFEGMLRVATSHPAEDFTVLDGKGTTYSDIYLDPILIKSYNEFERVGEKLVSDYAKYLLGDDKFYETRKTTLRKEISNNSVIKEKGDRFLAVRLALETTDLEKDLGNITQEENHQSISISSILKSKNPAPENLIEHLFVSMLLGHADIKGDNVLKRKKVDGGDAVVVIDFDIWDSNSPQVKIVQSLCHKLSDTIQKGGSLSDIKDILSFKTLSDRYRDLCIVLNLGATTADHQQQTKAAQERLDKGESFLRFSTNPSQSEVNASDPTRSEWNLLCTISQAISTSSTTKIRKMLDGATEKEILQLISSITNKNPFGLDEITERHLENPNQGVAVELGKQTEEGLNSLPGKHEEYHNSVKKSLEVVKEAVDERMKQNNILSKEKQQGEIASILTLQEDGTTTQTPINVSKIISYYAGYDSFVGGAAFGSGIDEDNSEVEFDGIIPYGIIPYGLFKNSQIDDYKVRIDSRDKHSAIQKLSPYNSFNNAKKLLAIIFPAIGHADEEGIQLQINDVQAFKSAFNKCDKGTKEHIKDNFDAALGALVELSNKDINYSPENNYNYKLMFERASKAASELFGIDCTKYLEVYKKELGKREKYTEICNGLLDLNLDKDENGNIIIFNNPGGNTGLSSSNKRRYVKLDSYELSHSDNLEQGTILAIIKAKITTKQKEKIALKNAIDAEAGSSEKPDLFTACKDGDLVEVKYFVEKDEDTTNSQKAEGLFIACQMGHSDVVNYLLEKEVDYKTEQKIYDNKGKKTSDATTPLGIACQNGHLDIVKMLCKRSGIELVKTEDKSGKTVLHRACGGKYDKNLKVIKYLCSAYPSLVIVKSRGKSELTPLSIASSHKNPEIVQYLSTLHPHKQGNDGISTSAQSTQTISEIKNSIPLSNKKNEASEDQLIIGCCHNLPDSVKQFIDSGADIAKEVILLKKMIQSDVSDAKLSGEKKIKPLGFNYEPSVEEGESISPLGLACKSGSAEVVKIIIDEIGSDYINKLDSSGFTPFQQACITKKIDVVNLLLYRAANDDISHNANDLIVQTTQTGESLLHIACETNDSELAELLLGIGAKLAFEKKENIGSFLLGKFDERFKAKKDIDAVTMLIGGICSKPFSEAIELNSNSMLSKLHEQNFEPTESEREQLRKIDKTSPLKSISKAILNAKPMLIYSLEGDMCRIGIEKGSDNHKFIPIHNTTQNTFIETNYEDTKTKYDLTQTKRSIFKNIKPHPYFEMLFPAFQSISTTNGHFEIRDVEAFKKSWKRVPYNKKGEIQRNLTEATNELLKLPHYDADWYKEISERAKKCFDIFDLPNSLDLQNKLDAELERRDVLKEIFSQYKTATKTNSLLPELTKQDYDKRGWGKHPIYLSAAPTTPNVTPRFSDTTLRIDEEGYECKKIIKDGKNYDIISDNYSSGVHIVNDDKTTKKVDLEQLKIIFADSLRVEQINPLLDLPFSNSLGAKQTNPASSTHLPPNKRSASTLKDSLQLSTIEDGEFKCRVIRGKAGSAEIYPNVDSVKDILKNVIIISAVESGASSKNSFNTLLETIKNTTNNEYTDTSDKYAKYASDLKVYNGFCQNIELYTGQVGVYNHVQTTSLDAKNAIEAALPSLVEELNTEISSTNEKSMAGSSGGGEPSADKNPTIISLYKSAKDNVNQRAIQVNKLKSAEKIQEATL